MNTIRVYQNEYEANYRFKVEGNVTDLSEKALLDVKRLSNKRWACGIGDLLEQNSNLEAKALEDLNGWEKGWEMPEKTMLALGIIASLTYKKIETESEFKKLESELLSGWRKKNGLSSTKVKSVKLASLMWDVSEQEILQNKNKFKLSVTILGNMYIADESLEEVFGEAKYNMRSEHVRKNL